MGFWLSCVKIMNKGVRQKLKQRIIRRIRRIRRILGRRHTGVLSTPGEAKGQSKVFWKNLFYTSRTFGYHFNKRHRNTFANEEPFFKGHPPPLPTYYILLEDMRKFLGDCHIRERFTGKPRYINNCNQNQNYNNIDLQSMYVHTYVPYSDQSIYIYIFTSFFFLCSVQRTMEWS